MPTRDDVTRWLVFWGLVIASSCVTLGTLFFATLAISVALNP
jgi:hypothetical protein